ncbi:MAG: hypothetical protein OQK59_07620 [Chlorobium sp.]|nr:hypothetical protein [Chlorobium sp.]
MIEESNVLSHLAQAFNPELSETSHVDNFQKARNHLIRATLDLNKLLLVELKTALDKVVLDEKKRLGFNKADHDVIKEYSEFIEKSRNAKRHEVKHIGNDPLQSIAMYEDACHSGFALYLSLDLSKAARVNKLRRIMTAKEFLWGLVVGLISSIIGGVILYFFQ